jgi:hypothetical protein
MGDKSETEAHCDGGWRAAGERMAQGEQQESAGEGIAEECDRRGARPAHRAESEDAESLKDDEGEDGVDEARIRDESHEARSGRR